MIRQLQSLRSGSRIWEMRIAGTIFLSLSILATAYEPVPRFDAAREVFEVHCLECHTPEKAEGDLDFTTREAMIRGGESGTSLKPGDPDDSELFTRVRLAPDDDERMPPKKHGKPLGPNEINALKQWIEAGAPWPEGEVLAAKSKTALPRWDAPADPRIVTIEAFLKNVALDGGGFSPCVGDRPFQGCIDS